MNTFFEDKTIKLVGIIEPWEGWAKNDGSPWLMINVPGSAKYLLENDQISEKLKEYVWEEVSLSGSFIQNNGAKLIKVGLFEPFDPNSDYGWDED